MTATLEEEDLITHTCVYETGTPNHPTECGTELPEEADHDEVFCTPHQNAIDQGDITWEEYDDYRRRYSA